MGSGWAVQAPPLVSLGREDAAMPAGRGALRTPVTVSCKRPSCSAYLGAKEEDLGAACLPHRSFSHLQIRQSPQSFNPFPRLPCPSRWFPAFLLASKALRKGPALPASSPSFCSVFPVGASSSPHVSPLLASSPDTAHTLHPACQLPCVPGEYKPLSPYLATTTPNFLGTLHDHGVPLSRGGPEHRAGPGMQRLNA